MTGQISDTFVYDSEEYSLVGYKGGKLFSPLDYGMQPRAASTACWRGFIVKYVCKDDSLYVDELEINADETKEINGVKAIENTGDYVRLPYLYENLNLSLSFSGKIRIATDFIQEMYVHMGFQRAMAYEKVLELKFKDGKLISIEDLSPKMLKKRQKNKSEGASPKSQNENDVREWIENTFSLEYEEEDRGD